MEFCLQTPCRTVAEHLFLIQVVSAGWKWIAFDHMRDKADERVIRIPPANFPIGSTVPSHWKIDISPRSGVLHMLQRLEHSGIKCECKIGIENPPVQDGGEKQQFERDITPLLGLGSFPEICKPQCLSLEPCLNGAMSQAEVTVSLRGKQWYGYYRQNVLDPKTETKQIKKICVKLGPRIGPKPKMTKSEARDALRIVVTNAAGQNAAGKVYKDTSVTFEWFVRNRYLPLRMGNWRPETAKEKISQIELDLIDKFGECSLDSFDKVMLQTHINDLAERYSQDRVKQARSYLSG